jgi:Domain of unknown function (DUF5011)/HYR domain
MMNMENLDRLLAPPAHVPSPPKKFFGLTSCTVGQPPDSGVAEGKKVCRMKLVRTLLMLLVAMVLSGPFDAKANYIRYSETIYSTDYLSAGVGGMRNFGYGTITLTNLTGTVRKAYLYWHGPMVMEATNPAVNAVVKVNGQTVVGSNLGMASDNCWFSQGYNYLISHAYRADVTSIVASNGNGKYLLTEFMKPFGTNAIGVNVNGASLLVFYDDGNPANNRDIVLFEGNDSNATSPFPTNSPAYDDIGWNVKLSGINYTSGPVAMQFHVSDGQYFEPLDDGPITMNNSIVLEPQGHAFSGNSVPSANNGPKNNGSLWDIRTYSIGQYLTNGVNTISVSNKFVLADCISLVAAVINLPAGAAPRTNAPPTIACQEPITLQSPDPAVIASQVTYSGVTAPAYDISVDGVIVKSGTLPASTNSAKATLSLTNSFGYGTHTVTFTLKDVIGTAMCSTAVTLPPNINCSPNLVQPTDVSKSNAVVSFTVTSDAATATIVCSPPSGSTFPLGLTTVNCTASDTIGNNATCSFQVNVVDIELPILRCPQNRIVSTEPGTNSAVVNYEIFASDNVPGVTTTCSPPSGSRFPLGASTVNCTATDLAGNAATCSFTVTVHDDEKPTFVVCPTNIVQTMDAGKSNAVVTWAVAASDNVPGVTVACTPRSGSVFPAGTTPVNCVATDLAGNTATCGFSVTVIDKEPPQITCPATILVGTDTNTCAASNVVYTLTVLDNVNAGTTYACSPPSGSTFAKGTNLVSCTATDAAGNQASCSFQVVVKDAQPPILSLPNIVHSTDSNSCSAVVTFNPVATDVCAGEVSIVCTPPSGSTFSKGATSVSCRATDGSGNSVTNAFTVTVEDKEAPIIACPANIGVPSDFGKSTAIVDFTVTATDNCGTPTVVSAPPSGSVFAMGTNIVTSTATDASGNQSTCTFLVIVRDIEPPKITCPISDLVVTNTPGLCSAPANYNIGATDNMHMAGVVCQPPSGAVFPVGTNQVKCIATDEAGNTNLCSFFIVVRDGEKPSLQLLGGGSITVECHAPFSDPGATASDNCGGNLSSSIKVTGTLDLNTPGTYTRTYTVTDASGNSASASRTIRVMDTRPPAIVLTGGSPFKVPCGKGYEEPGYTATDACAGDLSPAVVVSGSVDASSPGTYALTYTVTDPAGNSTTITRQVEVSSGLVEGGELYPIAVSKDSLAGVAVGDVVANIYNGAKPGNFGWLSWSGNSSAGSLASSLVPPGTSKNYVNPNNPNDHVVSVGDWVRGDSGLSNSKNVRDAMDNLKLMDITVPVYDVTTGSGGNTLYHVVALARFRLTNFDLTAQNKISARFLGYVTCTCEGTDLMSMSLESTFNNGNMSANTVLWFNSALQISGVKTNAAKIRMVNQTITGSGFNLSVSNASIIIDPSATTATTDFVKGEWVTRVPLTATNGNIFLSGLAYKLPANLAGNLKLAWNGTFVSDTPDVTLSWKWAVANYSDLGNDPNLLGVKPVDSAVLSAYKNADLAGTPEKMKTRLLPGHGSASNYTGAYSGVAVVSACNGADGQSLVKPKALKVQTLTGGKRSISWSSKSGKSYKVQYKDNLLATNWTDLPGTVTATGAVSVITDGSTGAAQRYYRVMMLP